MIILSSYYGFPFSRNALSLAMMKTLKEDLTHNPEELRVIIIKANGSVFSAGHDLKELVSIDDSNFKGKN